MHSPRSARMIPLSLATVGLLKLIPDGRQARLSPNLAVYAQEHRDWYRSSLAWLFDATVKGDLRPIVAERIPLTEAARAHELLERGGHAGKFVLVTDS